MSETALWVLFAAYVAIMSTLAVAWFVSEWRRRVLRRGVEWTVQS